MGIFVYINKKPALMNRGKTIILVGIIMTASGLVAFYSIQPSLSLDEEFRMIKHTGTFVGLMGIGVTIAGILLYIINRNQVPESQTMQ